MTRGRATAFAWLALLVTASNALAPSVVLKAQQQAYRAHVDVVTLTVTALDASHRPVTNLEIDDFLVFEDGRKQTITVFQKTDVPLAVALLLDTSSSMNRTLPLAQQAAVGFVRSLNRVDEAMVVDFDSRVRVVQPFTADGAALEEAIRQTQVRGSTALYNALYIASKEFDKRRTRDQSRRRHAAVVLSDGEDTASLVALDEVLRIASQSDLAIYPIGLLDRSRRGRRSRRTPGASFALQQLAYETGGRAFFPKKAGEFERIFQEIRTELSQQYALAYESDNAKRDGQYRRISVRINTPGVVARTRAGYYAPHP
jgi:Ca-activated chloride channel family protein